MKKKELDKLYGENKRGQKRFENFLRRKGKKYHNYGNVNQQPSILKGRHIKAPKIIDIYSPSSKQENYSGTIEFINKIEKHFLREKCIFDFRQTESFTAAALVLIYAALDAVKLNGNTKSIILWSKEAPIVNRSIKRTNIQKLVELRGVNKNFGNIRELPVVAGVGNEYMEDIIDFIQHRIYKNMSPETEHVYGDAVSETINNVELHAYPKKLNRDKSWWLLCEVIGDHLFLAIYDKGVGIPVTIIDKPWFWVSFEKEFPEEYEKLKKSHSQIGDNGYIPATIRELKDAHLVFLSMQGNRTGTKKSKHGQGSKSIKAMVSETNNGKLWVFSNNGLYKYRKAEEEPELYRLPKKFPGTLIQWNIKII